MEEFEIRKLDAGNFDAFVGLIEELASFEHLDPPDAAAKKRLRRDGLGRSPRYEAHVGYFGGRPVAYVIFFETYSSFLALPTLYLEDIFVLAEFRRKGVGKRMFEFCRGRAAELGCGRMEWCVLDWNEPAVRFYEKGGGERLPWFFYRMTAERLAP
jgi:GNAT superfamily N-acetyltransferase